MYNDITRSMSRLTKTLDEVRADLDRRGKSVRDWAREHGVSDRIVYELLRGRLKGRRGQTHKVAVLLGLKDGIVE
jgi:gp16 family phage-associated protein